MRANKQQRQERDKKWGINNSNPNSICEGKFYVWNKGEYEICKNRDVCAKYNRQQELLKNGRIIYKEPQVQFYYVDAFRRCNFYSKQ